MHRCGWLRFYAMGYGLEATGLLENCLDNGFEPPLYLIVIGANGSIKLMVWVDDHPQITLQFDTLQQVKSGKRVSCVQSRRAEDRRPSKELPSTRALRPADVFRHGLRPMQPFVASGGRHARASIGVALLVGDIRARVPVEPKYAFLRIGALGARAAKVAGRRDYWTAKDPILPTPRPVYYY